MKAISDTLPCENRRRAYIENPASAKPCSAIEPVIIFQFVNFNSLAIARRLQVRRHGQAGREGRSSLRAPQERRVHRREESAKIERQKARIGGGSLKRDQAGDCRSGFRWWRMEDGAAVAFRRRQGLELVGADDDEADDERW